MVRVKIDSLHLIKFFSLCEELTYKYGNAIKMLDNFVNMFTESIPERHGFVHRRVADTLIVLQILSRNNGGLVDGTVIELGISNYSILYIMTIELICALFFTFWIFICKTAIFVTMRTQWSYSIFSTGNKIPSGFSKNSNFFNFLYVLHCATCSKGLNNLS